MSASTIAISKCKQSLEYIPSPCLRSKKLKAMRRNVGKMAVLMYHDFMAYLGSQKNAGYWMVWDQECKDDFAIDNDYTLAEIDTHLQYFFDKGFFSKEIFEQHKVITGEEIQQAWLLCAKNRMRFIEGIIEPYMVVPFEKEIEENLKKFSKLNKMLNVKIEESTNAKEPSIEPSISVNLDKTSLVNPDMKEDLSLNAKNNKNGGRIRGSVTSNDKLQQSEALSRSVALSRSKKENSIHPTDVDSTCNDFSSPDTILNSFTSASLMNGFESELKNESNQHASDTKTSPPKPDSGDFGADSSKAKKLPHPARDGMIAIWEKGNNMIYVQDKMNNMAIPPLIRKLEALVIQEGNNATEAAIVQKYAWLWDNKGLLSEFLQKQFRTFFGIEKYFHDIVGDIWDHDKKVIQKHINPPSVRQPAYMRLISEMI